jgi:hypothetical protein
MTEAMNAVDRRRLLDPVESMHRPEEVATWLIATVCHAMGKPDVEGNWDDERALWAELATQGETIVTGINGGPTITAEAVQDPACDCERQLVAVPSTKKRR